MYIDICTKGDMFHPPAYLRLFPAYTGRTKRRGRLEYWFAPYNSIKTSTNQQHQD